MSRSQKKTNTPIDLKTIFGVVRSGDLKLVENFINDNGTQVINELDPDGFTPMHWAVYDGSYETVCYLVKLSADLDNSVSNQSGQKPIHWGCVKGRIDVVGLLLDNGVNINSQDAKGYTPLITACQYGQVALVAFLVSRGANLELEDFNGDTALHWAVYKGLPDLTRLLIIYGIYPKKIDSYGQTVLHLACLSGNLNIVQQLIEQDCIDTEIRDNNGKKAIDLASARLYSDIVDFIQRYNDRRKNICNFRIKHYGRRFLPNWSNKANLKTCLFGPVGNSKYIFLIIHILYWFYQYPLYFYKVLPNTWENHYLLHLIYFASNILFWVSYYGVHFKDPGYIKQNTREYQSALRRITFRSQHFTANDWHKSLSRLCHTCKSIKPLRASHCKACNRCVIVFDHHCPYVQNCIGYKNRTWFFMFVFSTVILQIVTARICYIVLSKDFHQYIFYPGLAIVLFFGIMVSLLGIGALSSVITNLTTNELVKRNKYDYLQTKVGQMKVKSIFDKGLIYNFKYYFHLVEQPHLETESFDTYQEYNI